MMQITVTAAIGAQVTSLTVDVEPKWMIHAVITEFCQQSDIPITGDMQMKDDRGRCLHKGDSIEEAGIHHGDTVYISQAPPTAGGDGEQQTVRVKSINMKRRGMISAVLVILGFVLVTASTCGIIALAIKYADEICIDEGYGAVFDAGSSHTNLTVYSWLGDSEVNGTGMVTQEGMCRSPGGAISSYDDNPQDAGPSLTSCLDYAKTIVPKQYYAYTSLHLGATAGMRLLNETQPATSGAIMRSVNETMASYPFNFSSDKATIITGFAEGTYGWVSANFLSGTLSAGSVFLNAVYSMFSTESPSTFGALDLGGASTQITFQPEDSSTLPPEYTAHLRLYGVDYKLYTHSYLCYGVNEAIRRFKANLVKDAQYATTTDNPCAPKGFSEAIDSEYLWKQPCSRQDQNLASWEQPETAPSLGAPNSTTFNLVGTSDFAGCQKAVEMLFDFNATCPQEPCSFDGVYQPKPHGNFLAFSTYGKLIAGLGLPENASLKAIQDTMKSFCAKTYDEIKEMSGNIQFLVLYCFDINYMLTLLLQAFHFDEDTWNIRFTEQVNGKELGWSLGFMINATNMIPTEASCSQFSTIGFYVGIAVLIMAFVVGCAALIAAICRVTRGTSDFNYKELDTNFANTSKYGSA